MASIIKVDTIQDQDGNNIINENANTITIGKSGDTVQVAAGATLEGAGLAWQSDIKTSAFTAVAGEGYWINTTSAAITMTLPASASVGDTIEFVDYARTWGTNNVTINPNSLNFQGGTGNAVFNVSGQAIRIVYSGSTKGWIPTDENTTINKQTVPIEYLIVGGGGSGGGDGGGGAGGMLSNYGSSTLSLSIGSVYTAVVGAGGAAVGQGVVGNTGANSTLSGDGISTITAFGGGGGGYTTSAGLAGGSGGGGGYSAGASGGGAGTSGQGNDGGIGLNSPNYPGGGGGGAGAAGGNGSGGAGGAGGTGLQNAITGTNTYYAGGGTGTVGASGAGTPGSLGGGGSGGRDFTAPGDGTDGLGGGGGGGGYNTNRSTGGSGIVILRVPTAKYSGTTTGSPTVTTDGTDTIIKFTGNGTYTA